MRRFETLSEASWARIQHYHALLFPRESGARSLLLLQDLNKVLVDSVASDQPWKSPRPFAQRAEERI
jgi:hypothetical protein